MFSKSIVRRLEHQLKLPVYNFCEIPSGRVRDIPEKYRKDFEKHLDSWGHTCPVHPTDPIQDYFYLGDFYNWLAGKPTDD